MSLNDLIAHFNIDLGVIRKARDSVMVALPLNPERKPEEVILRQYVLTGDEYVREKTYMEMITAMRPTLAEIVHDANFGLRKLVVPTRDGLAGGIYESQFVVDKDNYFFVRAASSSSHPYWTALRKLQSPHSSERQEQNWLSSDERGRTFIIQLRKSLRAFCAFQHNNRHLLNAFMALLTKFAGKGGLGAVVENCGFPPLLAERILDYLYAPLAAELDLQGIDWKHEDVNGFSLAQLDSDGNLERDSMGVPIIAMTVKLIAAAFRAVLLNLPAPSDITINRLTPIEEAGKLLAVKKYAHAFATAHKALHSIMEMLPCHVLAQEAIAWLLKSLSVEVCGDPAPTRAEQYIDVAHAVNHGRTLENGSRIVPPVNRGLSLRQRQAIKQEVLKNTDAIIRAMTGEGSLDSIPQQIRPQLQELIQSQSLVELVKSLIPENVDPSMRTVLRTGAQRLLRILFLTRVAPRMFNVPVFEDRDLAQMVQGLEIANILTANALGAGAAADEALAAVGNAQAKNISSILGTADDLSNDQLLKVSADSMSFLPVVAEALGPQIRANAELWRLAQNALVLVEGNDVRSFVSGCRSLRKSQVNRAPSDDEGLTASALDNSPLWIDERIIERLSRAAIERNRKIAELLATVESSRNEAEKANTDLKLVEKEINTLKTGGQSATSAVVSGDGTAGGESAVNRDGSDKSSIAELEEKRERLRSDQVAVNLKLEAKEADLREASSSNGTAPRDYPADESDSVGEIVDSLLNELGLKQPVPTDLQASPGQANPRLLEAPLDTLVEQAVAAFRASSSNRDSVENLLRAHEYLNHEVFEQYFGNLKVDEMIPYRRSVEAMTLGKLMRAMHNGDSSVGRKTFGLGGKSSGLMRAVFDLVEKTGLKGDDEVGAMELLGEVSLHTYLDGGLLRSGQQINNLRIKLEECAKQSFDNIRDFVAELHGIYYLFHMAGNNKSVYVVNASAGEFRTWFEKDNFELDGKGTFRSITQGNEQAANIRRPGLLYLSNLAFEEGSQRTEMSKWVELPTMKNDFRASIPPVLVASGRRPAETDESWSEGLNEIDAALRAGARFPWLLAGPPNLLNAKEDSEFVTLFPSAYALLADFLGRSGPSGVFTDNSGRSTSSGRIRRISGFNTSVDEDLRAALHDVGIAELGGVKLTSSFTADYYLTVVQALHEELISKNISEIQFFNSFWDDPGYPDRWTKDVAALTGLFFGTSHEGYRFDGDPMRAVKPALLRPDGTIINDLDWFFRAIRFNEGK